MRIQPCPVCGWLIPDHMAWPERAQLLQRTRCPNEMCSSDLYRRRVEIDADWGEWEAAA